MYSVLTQALREDPDGAGRINWFLPWAEKGSGWPSLQGTTGAEPIARNFREEQMWDPARRM